MGSRKVDTINLNGPSNELLTMLLCSVNLKLNKAFKNLYIYGADCREALLQ